MEEKLSILASSSGWDSVVLELQVYLILHQNSSWNNQIFIQVFTAGGLFVGLNAV